MKISRRGLYESLPRRPAPRRVALLVGGALTGLFIASIDLMTKWSAAADNLPPGAIARVGSRLITHSEFERVALDLATDRRTSADGDRLFSLQRIIDEELLVQRGVELGFPETAPNIRKTLAAAVIAHVVAEAEAVAPSRKELRAFYNSDTSFFAESERWRVRWLRANNEFRAMPTRQTVNGSLSVACSSKDDIQSANLEVVYELPNSPLPLGKLMDYMGPTLARRATSMQPGKCSEPVLIDNTYHVLYLEEHQPGRIPDFDGILDVVESEYVRRAGEKALLDYLQWLRKRTEIDIDEPALD